METDLQQDVIARMDLATGHAIAMGLKVLSIQVGRATMQIPWREELVGDPQTGVIAGGIITALLDHVSGTAVTATPGGYPCATLDLRIDYMRPAAPRATVSAEAVLFKITRSIAFVRAEAWDLDRSDLIAASQGAFALDPRQEGMR